MAKSRAQLKWQTRYIVRLIFLLCGVFLPLFGSQIVNAKEVNIQEVLWPMSTRIATYRINTIMPLTVENTTDSNEIASGVFGNGTWDIDINGKLNIKAVEGMTAYLPELRMNGSQVIGRPWEEYINQIKSVYVGERVLANYNYSNYLFSRMPNVTTIDVGNLHTEPVTSLREMFSYDPKLISIIGLENWNTSSVTDMSGMFEDSKALKDIHGIKNWNTSNLEDMGWMFNNTTITDFSPISDWNVSKLQSPNDLFANNSSVQKIDFNWDTSSITNLTRTFSGCTNLTEINGLDKFNTKNFIVLDYTFNGDSKLVSLNDIENWDTSNVISMSNTFNMCKSLTSLDLSNWNTSKVTNMNSMFSGDNNLNEITLKGLDKFDTGNVNNMSGMFSGTGFTELNLENFKTPNLQNMSSMFSSTKNLKKIDGIFDTSSVQNMDKLFKDSNISDFSNLNISNWDTSQLTSMEEMFRNTTGIKTLDLSNWNTSNVKSYYLMFDGAQALESIDISNFDMINTNDVTHMFYKTPKLWKVTFGPKSILSLSTNLHTGPGYENQIKLNTPISGTFISDTTNSAISDKWQAVDVAKGGIDHIPMGKLLSSVEIENLYTKAGGPKATYVWQQHRHIDMKMNIPNIDFGRTYNLAGIVKRQSKFVINVTNNSYPTGTVPTTIEVLMKTPFTDESDSTKTLNNVLVFKGQDNSEKIISKTNTKIYSGNIATGSNELSWDDDHGLLLDMNNDQFAKNGSYSARLDWTLTSSL